MSNAPSSTKSPPGCSSALLAGAQAALVLSASVGDMAQSAIDAVQTTECHQECAQDAVKRVLIRIEPDPHLLNKNLYRYDLLANQRSTTGQRLFKVPPSSGAMSLAAKEDQYVNNGESSQQSEYQEKLHRAVKAYKAERYVEARQILVSLLPDAPRDAELLLAILYLHGLGGDVDLEKAETLFASAERKGSVRAAIGLSELFFSEGRSGEAEELLRKYAQRGNAGIAMILAARYEYGRGFRQDLEKARHWYKIAYQNGARKAKEKLDELEGSSTP